LFKPNATALTWAALGIQLYFPVLIHRLIFFSKSFPDTYYVQR
jgi:hypothetical protein